jgi:hypothetical protein
MKGQSGSSSLDEFTASRAVLALAFAWGLAEAKIWIAFYSFLLCAIRFVV